MLLKVSFCFGKIDQDSSIQPYERIFEPFHGARSCAIIRQVYLLERSIARDTSSHCFGAFHNEGKVGDIAYGKLVWLLAW